MRNKQRFLSPDQLGFGWDIPPGGTPPAVSATRISEQPASVTSVSSEPDLTPQQFETVAARGNVLVSASAGTGKTRTLVERCIQCLVDEQPPVSLDEILIVTFTDA